MSAPGSTVVRESGRGLLMSIGKSAVGDGMGGQVFEKICNNFGKRDAALCGPDAGIAIGVVVNGNGDVFHSLAYVL
jgi:hypothetical protein